MVSWSATDLQGNLLRLTSLTWISNLNLAFIELLDPRTELGGVRGQGVASVTVTPVHWGPYWATIQVPHFAA